MHALWQRGSRGQLLQQAGRNEPVSPFFMRILPRPEQLESPRNSSVASFVGPGGFDRSLMLSGPLKRSDLHRIRKVYFALFSTFGKQSAAVFKIRIMASFLAYSPPDRPDRADRADCHTTASVSTLPLPLSSHAFGSHRAPRDPVALALKSRIPPLLGVLALFCHGSTPRDRRLRYRLGISGHPTTPKDQQPATLGCTKTHMWVPPLACSLCRSRSHLPPA